MAALVANVIGAVWFSPKAFFPVWWKLIGKTPEQQPGSSSMAYVFGMTFLGVLGYTFGLALVLEVITVAHGSLDVVTGAGIGALLGQPQRGVELHVVEALEAGIASWDGHRDDAIHPLALGEQLEANGGLHIEAKVAKAPESEQIAIRADGAHLHRSSTALEPSPMAIQVGLHHGSWRPHFHQIGKVAGVTAHPWIIDVAQALHGRGLCRGLDCHRCCWRS